MDIEIKKMLQTIMQKIDGVESRLEQKIDGVESRLEQKIDGVESRLEQKINGVESRLKQEIADSELRINIKIENEVTKKIESLFDGYKLTHDKQWEMERRLKAIEDKLGMVG